MLVCFTAFKIPFGCLPTALVLGWRSMQQADHELFHFAETSIQLHQQHSQRRLPCGYFVFYLAVLFQSKFQSESKYNIGYI